MLSILFTDRVDLEVANRLNVHHSLYLPPIRQVQLFFPPAEPRSDHNSTDLPVYELKLQHLSCFYCGKELGTLLLWTGFSFRFDTQPNEKKKENWLLRIYKPSLIGSRRHKQLVWVALHLF